MQSQMAFIMTSKRRIQRDSVDDKRLEANEYHGDCFLKSELFNNNGHKA